MKKLLVTAGLLGSALLATNAMAQSSSTPAQPGAASSTSSSSPGFLTQLTPDTMLVSKLMDEDVVGADNKDIGDVEDVVIDRNGQVVAVVVEIDEGIGDRTVALPMNAFQISPDAETTGSVQGSNQTSGSSSARMSDDLRVMLSMPVDQLKAAPEFDEDND